MEALSNSKDPKNTTNQKLIEKYSELQAKNKILDKEIDELIKQGINTDLKPQMQALHEYNEMKDLAQVILGYLADIEQTTVTKLHERYGLPLE